MTCAERLPQRLVHRPVLQLDERALDRRHAASGERRRELGVGLARRSVHAAELVEHVILERAELPVEAAVDLAHRSQVFQALRRIAEDHPRALADVDAKRLGDVGRGGASVLAARGNRPENTPSRVLELVVVEDERALATHAVGVGVHVLVDASVLRHEVVERELYDPAEEVALLHDREDLALVPLDERAVARLVPLRAAVLHAVLLVQALDLTVAEHREAGHRAHQRADAEVLVVVAELRDRGVLVRVVHEVDEALQDLRLEVEDVLDRLAILVVLLALQHVHECRVVDTVHAQRADEVALHHPERLGEKQGVGRARLHRVDDLAPELEGEDAVELLLRHRVIRARGNGAAAAGQREPEPGEVALRERHRRVEADDREHARDVEDGFDDRVADLGLRVIELRGVVPRHAGAVVAVVDEAVLTGLAVVAAEHDGGVGLVPVALLDEHADARILGEIRPAELVAGEGRLRGLDEPVGVVHDPLGVDADMIGHHVGGEAEATLPGALFEVLVGSVPAELPRDVVLHQRVRRRDGILVASHLLHLLRRVAALEEADEPQPGEAA